MVTIICGIKIDCIISEPYNVKFFFMNLLHSQAIQIFDVACEDIVKYINMSKVSIPPEQTPPQEQTPLPHEQNDRQV